MKEKKLFLKKIVSKKKLDESDCQQIKPLEDRYQDEKKIASTHQQKFVEYTRQLRPQVIEELREFVPYFEKLMGKQKENYINIFNTYKRAFPNLEILLEDEINLSILKDDFLKFRPDKYRLHLMFEQEETPDEEAEISRAAQQHYKWGEHRLLLNLLYLVFGQGETSDEKAEISQAAAVELHDNLVIERDNIKLPDNFDESNLQRYVIKQSYKIVKEILWNDEQKIFREEAKKKVIEFLQDISPDPESGIADFIVLQVELLKWAERHGLQKDWLLRYAYDFLYQFSNKLDIKLADIEISLLDIRSLTTYPFVFEFDGWSDPYEKKEEYKKRLTESFKTELERYFHNVSENNASEISDLDEQKRIRRPKDPDFKSIKWRIAWNEGATEAEIAECFGLSPDAVKKGKEGLLKYDLPNRIGKSGRKKRRLVSKERLLEIKNSRIGEKST